MAGIRVHKLASELGISSQVLLEELKKEGIEVKSHMSSLDKETVEIIREILTEKLKETKGHKNEVSAAEKKKTEKEIILKARGKTSNIEEKEIPEAVENGKEVKKKKKSSIKEKDKIHPEQKEESQHKIRFTEAITVKELSEKIGCKPTDAIKKLMEMGIMATINQILDINVAVTLTKKFNIAAEVISLESDRELFEEEDGSEEEDLIVRPSVVTIMGHVDHGKTSLLDAIRETNVTDKEAGGITQHIGAYKVKLDKGEIVFLDTPGHEAFTAMRARGVQVTDIVVLVVAADDGVMPQTAEAIHHARAANVPIVVAINKIDKPNAAPDVVKRKLMEYNLVSEEFGGDTIFAEVSAKKKTGIENLLEMILLQAEIMELKANPKTTASGIIIEAKLDKGRGPVATVLVRKGTLRVGQPFIVGLHYGKIRALINSSGQKVKEVAPSTPVEVLGFSAVPNSGDSFIVVKDEKKARQIGTLRLRKQRLEDLSAASRVTLDDLYAKINKGDIKELKIVVKADVHGSVQALTEALDKLSTKDVHIKVIHGATGGITDTDIMLASASNAIVIGFNIRPSEKSAELAKKEDVDVRLYTVIYKAISDIKSAMEGLLEPTVTEKVLGRAEVREVFNIPKIGTIAGCYVTSGMIRRNSETRLIRDNVIVYQGKIVSLRRFKEDAKEVPNGFECGIGIEKFQDIKQGDIIEPFVYEETPRRL